MIRKALLGGCAALILTTPALAGDGPRVQPVPESHAYTEDAARPYQQPAVPAQSYGHGPQAFSGALPPNAEPGACYAHVRIPAQYDVYTEELTAADTYETYQALPPRLGPEVREYVRRDAAFRYIVHEPVYETVVEQVLLRPAYEEYIVSDAVHDTVTEQVMVREPRLVWQRGYSSDAQMTRFDAETGEIWCLVEEPGEYRTVTRQVVLQPARYETIEHPAEYATITREVLVREASVEQIPIPAEYAEYSYQVLTQRASIDSRLVEGRTQTVERYVLRSEERFEWVRMDCDDIAVDAYPQQQHPAPQSQAPGRTYSPSYDQEPGDETYDERTPLASAEGGLVDPAMLRMASARR